MNSFDDNISVLRDYLLSYGLELDEASLLLLIRHVDLVIEKNKAFNLTRINNEQDAIVRHIVDSLLLLPSIKMCGLSAKNSFVDIGTGGGFPGIPLGIATGMRGLLIDSVGKKVNAVKEFIEELGLADHLEAEAMRAEELALRSPNMFDLVTARAVADLGVLVEYASPLLSQGGFLIVSKARIQEDELLRGVKTAEIVGMRYVSRETYELPNQAGHREILTYQRKGKSKLRLPRAVGAAKHKPLA